MLTTLKPTIDLKPYTTASGTIARPGRWWIPWESLYTCWFLVGLYIGDELLEEIGPPQIGFDLPRETSYGNG